MFAAYGDMFDRLLARKRFWTGAGNVTGNAGSGAGHTGAVG
jgi:hypothetical protein